MSRIIIFGDSFAQDWDFEWTWTKLLAKKLNAEQVNYAIGGSSIEYSMYQFTEYLKNNHRDNDKIIFVATEPNRSPIVHPKYDPTSAALHTLTGDKEFKQAWELFDKQVLKYQDVKFNAWKYTIVASMLNSINNDAIMLTAFERCEEHSTRDNFIISQTVLLDYSLKNHSKLPNHFEPHNHQAMAHGAEQTFINKKDLFQLHTLKYNLFQLVNKEQKI